MNRLGPDLNLPGRAECAEQSDWQVAASMLALLLQLRLLLGGDRLIGARHHPHHPQVHTWASLLRRHRPRIWALWRGQVWVQGAARMMMWMRLPEFQTGDCQ